ncbi:MAG: GH3 auxin-responsive promoter family protein [bacterium]|nr:GH3 auxin-responsive promoter family protein [bacterium]
MLKKCSLASLIFAYRYRALQASIANPTLAQNRIFRYLIRKGRHTLFGRDHNFAHIKSYNDYCRLVPLSRYEDIKPYIERLLHGENYILWPEKIKYFSKSSGTTSSKSKYIPVSNSALNDCHYRGGRSLLACYFTQNLNSNLLRGQNFALGGSRQKDEIGEGKYIADVSAILMKKLPWWAQLRRSPRFSIASMSEWEEKLLRITEVIAFQNIVSLSGVPSWNLALAKKILELTGKKNLREVWPKLELFMHGGTSMAPYKEQFKALVGADDMHYLEVYNASEGYFAFQDKLERQDMLLFVDGGIFYEFVPLEELSKANPHALTLNEVELDKNYALVISTNAGLWRYVIGDTVKFTSLKPYRIIITGRTKSFINACGEELVVENADEAVKEACRQSEANVKEYTAAPLFGAGKEAVACHQWLFEFEQAPADINEFGLALDRELRCRNSDYEAKRHKDMNLGPPRLIVARENVFYDWLKQNKRLGGQSKIPRLANDRQIMDVLLSLNEER